MIGPYLGDVESVIPRILSMVDPESFSKTYGSADRLYWGWKFTDFPGARFQEVVYPLAWLYRRAQAELGEWKGNPALLELCRAGMSYWSRIQYSDGSFDEAYPFERSLAAVAFTVFYLTEAFELIRDELTAAEREAFLATVRRSADWLLINDEKHGVLSNHLAAAAAALCNADRLLDGGSGKYQQRCDHFLSIIFDHQDADEGWYEEYGGADPGYQTHGTFYLARIWQRTRSEKLLASLRKANAFLAYFVHPDGSVGGDYASRNTTFYFPAAFEMLAAECPNAAAIANEQRPRVERGETVGLRQMDPQNVFPMLNNYLFAHDAMSAAVGESLPWRSLEGQRKFERAGLLVRGTQAYYAIVSFSKGGVLSCWEKREGKLAFQSAGYVAEIHGKKHSTQAPGAEVQQSGDTLEINAPLVPLKQTVFNPWLFGGFRLFTLLIGRSKQIGYRVKRLLVTVLVHQKKAGRTARVRRIFRFGEDRILIEDFLDASDEAGAVSRMTHQYCFSPIHMGSSRYVHPESLKQRGRCFPRARVEKPGAGVLQRVDVRFV